ncbi:hypothetical protein NXC24_PB00305 (plasmid) [Rhizobium sp. NXC24]|nr:hypothetical protein NXC24_PB00305 [Rhizobium sp. NXC24]
MVSCVDGCRRHGHLRDGFSNPRRRSMIGELALFVGGTRDDPRERRGHRGLRRYFAFEVACLRASPFVVLIQTSLRAPIQNRSR